MWIPTRSQYGMRALVEIARGGERLTSLKVVSVCQGLSQQYLEQIFVVLRRGGLVESVRTILSTTKPSDLLDDGSLMKLGPLPEQFAKVT
jgi:hypothetical protein